MRDAPAEAEAISHQLLVRGGFIRQLQSGHYSMLPLGWKIHKKVSAIIREEMDRAGCQELLMPTIQPAEIWRESGRYDDYGKEMLRISDRHDRDMLYGPTNEEMITEIVRTNITSYKDLPKNLYHQQWKFRDEVRPRFGVMRGKEFLMKDAYSFDLTREDAIQSYNKMFVAYLRIFERIGLKAIPMQAEAGPIGGDLSHEFVILAENGESRIFCHKNILDFEVPGENVDYTTNLQPIVDKWTSLYAVTDEKVDKKQNEKLGDKLVSARGIEVGHIFYFGDKYSKSMNASVTGSDGKETNLEMGSYGIGVSRLVGAIIESSHDHNGIIWPETVAPFKIGIINLRVGDKDCDSMSAEIYNRMLVNGIEVIYDDRSENAGNKFGNMDLIGVPWQLLVGPRSLKQGKVELKSRVSGVTEELTFDEVMNLFIG